MYGNGSGGGLAGTGLTLTIGGSAFGSTAIVGFGALLLVLGGSLLLLGRRTRRGR